METLLTTLLTSIIQGSITYGPFTGLLLYIYINERSERRACQADLKELHERSIKGLHDATSAVNAGTSAQSSVLMTLSTIKDFVMSGRPRD